MDKLAGARGGLKERSFVRWVQELVPVQYSEEKGALSPLSALSTIFRETENRAGRNAGDSLLSAVPGCEAVDYSEVSRVDYSEVFPSYCALHLNPQFRAVSKLLFRGLHLPRRGVREGRRRAVRWESWVCVSCVLLTPVAFCPP